MKRGISPIVATALLFIIAVLAVVGFTAFMDSQDLLYEEPKPKPIQMNYEMFCNELGYEYYSQESQGFDVYHICYNDLVNKTFEREHIKYIDYKLWAKARCKQLNLTFYTNLGNGVCNK